MPAETESPAGESALDSSYSNFKKKKSPKFRRRNEVNPEPISSATTSALSGPQPTTFHDGNDVVSGAPPRPRSVLGRRQSRNLIELPLPPIDTAKKHITRTHMNELNDYLQKTTNSEAAGSAPPPAPAPDVPKKVAAAGESNKEESAPPPPPGGLTKEKTFVGKPHLSGVVKPDSGGGGGGGGGGAGGRPAPTSSQDYPERFTYRPPSRSDETENQTLARLMKERVYLKKDLEETMEKLDEVYNHHRLASSELQIHKQQNEKLRSKLEVMEDALNRAHQREKELDDKIKMRDEMADAFQNKLNSAKDSKDQVQMAAADFARLEVRAKELRTREEELETRMVEVKTQEDNIDAHTRKLKQELKDAKKKIHDLELERSDLERQLAEATPFPPSRMSQLTDVDEETEEDEEDDERDSDAESIDVSRRKYTKVTPKRDASKRKQKSKKDKTKEDKKEKESGNGEERPRSSACNIL